MSLKNIVGDLPKAVIHGLMLLSGTALAQLIPALLSPALTRIYSPADFGIFAITFAILGVLAPIVCLRYDIAIVLPHNDDEASRLIVLCFAIAFALALLSMVGCAVFWFFAPTPKSAAIAAPLIAMIPIGVFLLGLQKVGQSWSLRRKDFKIQSAALLTQAGVSIVTQIVLGFFWGSNPFFLIVGAQIGLFASVVVFLVALRSHVISDITPNVSTGGLISTFHQYIRFPLYTAPYAFAGQAASRATLVILSTLASAGVVGQYALAQRVVFLPLSTVMGTASQVFYSRVARRLSDPRLQSTIRWTLVSSALILGPFFALAFIYAESIFAFVFGERWSQAGGFALLLIAPSMLITLTAWMDRVYDVLARQRLALLMEIANDSVALGALIVILLITHSAIFAVAGFAVATVGFYLIWTFVTLQLINVRAIVFFEFVSTLAFVVLSLLAVAKLVAFLSANSWICAATLMALASAYIVAGARHAWRGLGSMTPRAAER
jgi:O-antigen/teichoic acid export membrane protein